MKHILIALFILFFVSKINGQVCVVKYCDSNFVTTKVDSGYIQYELNSEAINRGEWRRTDEGNKIISSLYFENSDFLIFSFIKFKDSIIVEREYYAKGNIKSEIGYSTILDISARKLVDDPLITPVVLMLFFKSRNGRYKVFFPNDKLQQSGEYYSDDTYYYELKIGNWREFYETGNLKSSKKYIRLWKASMLDGAFYEYFDNGNLKTEGNYNAALASKLYTDSIWHIYMETGNWTGGIKDGTWKEYNEKEELIKHETYKDGELIEQKKIKFKE